MGKVWKQERPEFCTHLDCQFIFRVTDSMCGGKLPKPEPHGADFNTHRFCLNGVDGAEEIFDLQVNKSDIWWFRKMFDEMFPAEPSKQEKK